jgi:hypothetical protein
MTHEQIALYSILFHQLGAHANTIMAFGGGMDAAEVNAQYLMRLTDENYDIQPNASIDVGLSDDGVVRIVHISDTGAEHRNAYKEYAPDIRAVRLEIRSDYAARVPVFACDGYVILDCELMSEWSTADADLYSATVVDQGVEQTLKLAKAYLLADRHGHSLHFKKGDAVRRLLQQPEMLRAIP